MFLHVLKNSFKILIKNKIIIFWTTIFSILLAIMFKLSLSGVADIDKFEPIHIAINEEVLEDEYFEKYIEELEKEKYIETTKLQKEVNGIKRSNKDIEEEILKDKEIVAYVESENNILMTKNASITKQTIIKALFDGYLQNKSMITNMIEEKGIVVLADLNKIFKFDTYIEDVTNKNMDILTTYFYTLIGMQAIYSFIWGLKVMYMYEANLSTEGKRNSVAPINKTTSIFASLLVAWIFSIISCSIIFVFISYILEVNLGDKFKEIVGLIILRNFNRCKFWKLYCCK